MADVVHAFAVPVHPSSVGLARTELRDVLRPAAQPVALVEDAAPVLSELVANALSHARPTRTDDIGVEVRLVGDRLHVAVTDGGSDSVPEIVSAPGVRPSGRGLFLVDALSDRWWWEPAEHGRTVRAELRCPAATE